MLHLPRCLASFVTGVLSVRLSWFLLQEEFDGVLREDVVAEALSRLGRSGSGTEQVYLDLTLPVSMTRSPLSGSTLTLAGPRPSFSGTHPFRGPPISEPCIGCTLVIRVISVNVRHQRALASPIISASNSFVFIPFTAYFFHLK